MDTSQLGALGKERDKNVLDRAPGLASNRNLLYDDALALVVDCVRLDITEEVRGLAKILVREKVMPGPAEEGDAVHVAAAIVHRCEYLITWNVKHMANPNKLAHLRNVCRRVGFAVPDLVAPEYLWDLDEGA